MVTSLLIYEKRQEIGSAATLPHCLCVALCALCRMYPAMETLIEPHRLIACIICVVSAARPMLSARKYYPDGPNHILPLLQLALPGIDPNDFKKTLVSADWP